jgi:hypothetical protein
MKNWKYLLNGLSACLALGALVGCAMLQTPTDELLQNPSFHILVNDEMSIPDSGVFDFDTKLFKLDYDEAFDLAEIDQRLVAAMKAEFKGKGLTRSTKNPDLLVSYAVAVDAPLSGADFNEAYADDFPISVPEPEPGQDLNYHQGALIVDVVDAKSRKLLWRGAIMARLSMDVSKSEKERRTREAIRILLVHFPKPVAE